MSHPTSIKGVLLVNGRVVLVKNPRSEWELPGGRTDGEEDHAATLVREFEEELSLKVAIADPIDSYLFEVIPVAMSSLSPTAARWPGNSDRS